MTENENDELEETFEEHQLFLAVSLSFDMLGIITIALWIGLIFNALDWPPFDSWHRGTWIVLIASWAIMLALSHTLRTIAEKR